MLTLRGLAYQEFGQSCHLQLMVAGDSYRWSAIRHDQHSICSLKPKRSNHATFFQFPSWQMETKHCISHLYM